MIESDGPGGAEYTVLNLAEELRRRGHVVCPVVPAEGCGWLAGELRSRGFEPGTFTLRRPLDPRCVAELLRLFRRRRIGVVHTHEFTMAVYGAAAAWIARTPHIITMHGGGYFAGRWRRRAALRWAMRRSHATVAVSGATRAALEEALGPLGTPIVIPNGVPHRVGHGDGVRRTLGLAPDEPLILSVGNLYPVKGHRVLLEALSLLRTSRPELPWSAAIAGRGEEEEALRRFAAEHGLADRVHLLGLRDDVPDLLAAAEIFVLPSLSEGLPLALLEAMTAGKAIAASRVGGIPEAARPEREALLVPPRDPHALAAALGRLVADPALRGRLAAAARRRMRTGFSLEAMTRAYERLYFAAASRGTQAANRPLPAPAGSPPPEPGGAGGTTAGARPLARSGSRPGGRLNIHHLLAPAVVGGAESVVRALAVGQRRAGHDVAVSAILTAGGAEPYFLSALEREGVRVFRIAVPARAYLRERAMVRDICRRLRPDILHTHGYRPDVVDAGTARSLGIPTVATVHGFTGGGVKNRLYQSLQCLAFRRFGAVVAVSRPLADRLARAGVPASRTRVIPNAWDGDVVPVERRDARRRLSVGSGLFHLGWVGRLSHEKGPDVLLDALEYLADLPLAVSIVGDGPEGPALRARTAADPRVRWHGLVPEAGRLFAGFDVFVLSSRTEGTPIVLLEAMAAGVPAVATRVGGVPHVVSSAEALLVPPEEPRALAAAIRSVYQDGAGAAIRALAGRERLDAEFALPAWLERYDAVYDDLLRSAG